MSQTRSPEELRAILAELESLGEDPGPDLREELARAETLEAALGAEGSLDALPEGLDGVAQGLGRELAALHLLRASAGADQLSEARAGALWEGVAAKLPSTRGAQPLPSPGQEAALPGQEARVVPFPGLGAPMDTKRQTRAGAPWGWYASAAAVLLAVGGVWLGSQGEGPAWDLEAQRAEARLARVERERLGALMAGSADAPTGDHSLRELRAARQDSALARLQARARRL